MVIDHHVQLYVDPNGKIVKAMLPRDIRKAGLFSVTMTAFAGYLKARGHTNPAYKFAKNLPIMENPSVSPCWAL
jgi:hypothetical protein